MTAAVIADLQSQGYNVSIDDPRDFVPGPETAYVDVRCPNNHDDGSTGGIGTG